MIDTPREAWGYYSGKVLWGARGYDICGESLSVARFGIRDPILVKKLYVSLYTLHAAMLRTVLCQWVMGKMVPACAGCGVCISNLHTGSRFDVPLLIVIRLQMNLML